MCWNRKVVVSVLVVEANYVCCKTADVAGNEYYVAFVYGSPYLSQRATIWNKIIGIIQNYKGRWVLIGDFNQVENNEQKIGGSNLIRGASVFREWKLENNLIDIHSHGANFTWTNNRKNKEVIDERIDKVFSNKEWKDMFPETWNLPILLSDHSPIILHLYEKLQAKKKRPYRLDAWSLNHDEVIKIIKQEWSTMHIGSSAHYYKEKSGLL